MKRFEDLPLRERKASKKRLAIYDAGRELLKDVTLGNIKIEEICELAQVSRSTFFSYFPRKMDLIIYDIRLWGLEKGYDMQHLPQEELGLVYIENIYRELAETMQNQSPYWADVMVLRACEPRTIHRLNTDPTPIIPLGDRLLRFPDKEGIDTFPEATAYNLVKRNLAIAVKKGELPPDTDLHSALIVVNSILYGSAVILAGYSNLETLSWELQKQLQLIWNGLRHPATKG